MKRILLAVLSVVGVTRVSAGEVASPDKLGAHWARVSDQAQIQLIIDEARSVAAGRSSERIVRKHVAPNLQIPSATQSHAGSRDIGPARHARITVAGSNATAEFGSGEKLLFEKINNTWRIVGGAMKLLENASGPSITSAMGSGVSVGETFIHTPVSREHGIDRLTWEVTTEKIDRALFSVPDKTTSYYYAHYMNSAPYVEATYIQFVTDPEWNRIVYGNMNRWLKSYDNVKGPSSITSDADGRVFVGETGNKRVTVLRVIGTGNDASLQPQFFIEGMTSPTDIALDDRGTPLQTADDNLYVADAASNKILKFSVGASSASLVAAFGGFESPTAIIVGKWNGVSNGLLYVVDKIAKRIRVFEDLGAELSLIKEVNGDYSQCFKSIKTDHFGNIYLVDNVNSQILKFTSSLELLDVQGGHEMFAALGNVDIPFGKIVVDGEGTYWAGFDQMFAVEQWGESSGAQRRTLGLRMKNIDFRTDDDISVITNVFTLTDFGDVNVRVYDNENRLVRNLGSSWMVSGGKNIVWDRRNDAGEQVASGNYRYEIGAKSAYRDEPTISVTRFYLPLYYSEDCGSAHRQDDAHLVQGSAVAWGPEPSQTANEHASAVQYRFTGLNPASKYEVASEYVANDGAERLQDMTANGVRVHEVMAVSSSPLKTGYHSIPSESYPDGEVTISINRRGEGTAIVSQLWLKEVGVAFSPQAVNTIIPTAYTLDQNYPNPFNPSTIIRYAVPSDGPLTLKVYSITGQEVATLVNELKRAGVYEIRFDAASNGKTLASGVYFYQVKAGDFTATRKMLLVK